MGEAEIRARYLKVTLAALAETTDGQRVLAAIPPAARTAIDASSGMDWIPADLDLAVIHQVYGLLPAADARWLIRSAAKRVTNSPLLETLVSTVVFLVASTPDGLAAQLPRAWDLVMRGAGEWRLSNREAGAATMELYRAPHDLRTDPYWPLSVSHALEAIFDISGEPGGTCTYEPAPTGPLRFMLRW